jgi:hypothetical protein
MGEDRTNSSDLQLPHGVTQQNRAAILYRTHFWSDAVAAEVEKLIGEAGDTHDIWVIGYVAAGGDFAVPPHIRKITLIENHLNAMGLPRCPRHPNLRARRNLDLPPLFFFRMLPHYAHYWIIEYDVRYTGNWQTLFDELNNPAIDLLGTIVQSRHENPEWHHWPALCTGASQINPKHHIKMFTPLFRLSNRGFRAVDAAYRQGWHGHYEALWPTAIAAANMTIEDIGATGSFTPKNRHNKHYSADFMHPQLTPGTFTFRPPKSETEIPPTPPLLWHPVKPASTPTWFPGAVGGRRG